MLNRSDFVRSAKEWLRPWKHLLTGENDINRVLRDIVRCRKTPVRVVVDAGAARGDMTVKFLHQFPIAIIHCFEPQAAFLQHLRHRFQSERRVSIYACGLYDKAIMMPLRRYQNPEGTSVLPIQPFMMHDNGEISLEQVELRPLDDFKFDHVDFLKVDVEGVELEVFWGAWNTLKRTDNVFVEISPRRRGDHNRDYLTTLERLHKHGFQFIGVYGDFFFSRDPEVLEGWT